MKFLMLIVKNVFRNFIRSALTAMGVMVLVLVVIMVWSVLSYLGKATQEQSDNLKGIVTERWQIPSRMPFSYSVTLEQGAASDPLVGKLPSDSMTWQFYGGTLDRTAMTPDNFLFAIAMEPDKLGTMMDELELKTLSTADRASFSQAIERLKENRQGIILGAGKLNQINKRVGDRIKIFSVNYRDIDLEFEIVGEFPRGRYDLSAAMQRDYLNNALDLYATNHNGKKHFMADKTLNLVWLRMKDMNMFSEVGNQIESSPNYSNPSVKFETASSGVSAFIEPYRDLLSAMQWLLAPAILVVLSLVIANSISISVRERRTELAVLKVLGFRPYQLLVLVLGESLLIGGFAGLVSAAGTYFALNKLYGGIPFPIAFFSVIPIPAWAVLWGFLVGVGTSLAGSLLPAWSARNVKVSEVFAKIT